MPLASWIDTPAGPMDIPRLERRQRQTPLLFDCLRLLLTKLTIVGLITLPELISASRVLGYRHHLSTENRPQSNGVAERNMRRILEGIRAALHDSGLSRRYWHLAMRCYCALHNFVDVWKLDKTPHELRFNSKFKGKLIPSGFKVYYMPTLNMMTTNDPNLVLALYQVYVLVTSFILVVFGAKSISLLISMP